MSSFSIHSLSFAYPGAQTKALDEVSFAAEPGDFLVLCGPSGCGKSTLGVLLAKSLGMNFLDTDLVIQQREGKQYHNKVFPAAVSDEK